VDVESPHHLERLRGQPEVKAALLRLHASPEAPEARFERAPRNEAYWPPLLTLDRQVVGAGMPRYLQEDLTCYGRPCWILCVPLAESSGSPYAVAVTAADGAAAEVLADLLRDVTHDYWYGSYFFK